MEYNYNGTIIQLKNKTCRLWNNEPCEIYPQANLYIRLTNKCNCNCKFCEYHGKDTEFDLDKFDKVLKDLSNRRILGKIQITGGEPTVNTKRLKQVVYLIRQYFPDIFIGVNSNGSDLQILKSLLVSNNKNYKINNVSISRHHYDDAINRKIFGVNVFSDIPNENQIKAFVSQVEQETGESAEKIHFSCNLIKGYIYDINTIKKYIAWAAGIGIENVGFVSLMDINEFTRENRVDFIPIIDNNLDFLKYNQYTKEVNNNVCCKCANYVYYCALYNRLVEIYGRYVVEHRDTNGQLVFDGTNLKTGFNGDIISI